MHAARIEHSSLGIAWDEFMRTIDEAARLIDRRGEWSAIVELVRHARELLGTIEWEIANSRVVTAVGIGETLARLRDRLQSLDKVVATPVWH